MNEEAWGAIAQLEAQTRFLRANREADTKKLDRLMSEWLAVVTRLEAEVKRLDALVERLVELVASQCGVPPFTICGEVPADVFDIGGGPEPAIQ